MANYGKYRYGAERYGARWIRGDQLKAFRLAKGWTQAELGKRLRVNASTISRWERDKARVPDQYEAPLRALGWRP